MSWQDKIKNSVFSIETGDGKRYFPEWKPQEIKKDFNTSIYEFIEVEGSFIDRKKRKSNSLSLVFWFQGEDNIDLADSFYQSADDERYWILNHPYYGIINGQPLSITRNDESYNSTMFSVDFWETIEEGSPKRKRAVREAVFLKSSGVKIESPKIYASKVDIKTKDVNLAKNVSTKISSDISKLVDSSNFSEFQKLKTDSFNSLDDLTLDPIKGITSVISMISAPSSFLVSITTRLDLYVAVFDSVKSLLLLDNGRNSKAYFEAVASAVLAAMTESVTTPSTSDYIVRNDVLEASEIINNTYEEYISVLENSYIPESDVSNSFHASAGLQNQVQSMVLEATSNLFNLAFEAKQERLVVLEKDSNLILLTHKYMGLDSEDKNLETFREINKIRNKKLFRIPKGTVIKYLV